MASHKVLATLHTLDRYIYQSFIHQYLQIFQIIKCSSPLCHDKQKNLICDITLAESVHQMPMKKLIFFHAFYLITKFLIYRSHYFLQQILMVFCLIYTSCLGWSFPLICHLKQPAELVLILRGTTTELVASRTLSELI